VANIIIDTRIWALALKTPFLAEHDPAVQEAVQAKAFVRTALKENRLLISSHLATEIFQVLTREGNRIPADQARRIVSDILDRKDTIFRAITPDLLMRAMDRSAASGIHVSDYLTALPFEDTLDVIYTMDPHYQHPTFVSLGRIENPLEIWRSEDQE